jgi:putative transposase
MLIAVEFLHSIYDKQIRKTSRVSTDECGTWHHPQACRFLKIKHHLHLSNEKSIIERTLLRREQIPEGNWHQMVEV